MKNREGKANKILFYMKYPTANLFRKHINIEYTTDKYSFHIWHLGDTSAPVHEMTTYGRIAVCSITIKAQQVTWTYMGSWLKRLNNALIGLINSVVCNRKAALLVKNLFSTYHLYKVYDRHLLKARCSHQSMTKSLLSKGFWEDN